MWQSNFLKKTVVETCIYIIYVYIHTSIYLSIYLSVCLSVYLSIYIECQIDINNSTRYTYIGENKLTCLIT